MISNQGKKYLEIKQKTNRDLRNLGPLVQFRDTDLTVASQTDYTLSFAVPIANKQLFKLHIDGNLLTEGASNDFEFIEISSGVSSKIRLTASPIAGLLIDYELSGARIAEFPSPLTVQAEINDLKNVGGLWANVPIANLYTGRQYFDTTLKKPFFYNSGDITWYDATGSAHP